MLHKLFIIDSNNLIEILHGVSMYHSNMLNVSKTHEILEEFKFPFEKEIIDLKDGNSRVLAQEIMVMIDVPPFNRSAMDGYAVIAD